MENLNVFFLSLFNSKSSGKSSRPIESSYSIPIFNALNFMKSIVYFVTELRNALIRPNITKIWHLGLKNTRFGLHTGKCGKQNKLQ